jgi:hypothetical protein
MNFVLTSLAAVQDRAIEHLRDSSGWDVTGARFGAATLLQLSSKVRATTGDQWSVYDSIMSICAASASNLEESLPPAYAAVHEYRDGDAQWGFKHSLPCILLDSQEHLLWVSADTVSGVPIWYAFQEGQYMVTTDLLVAQKSGFTEPTALGPGQVMVISTSNLEVVAVHDSVLQYTTGLSESTDILEVYSRRLATTAVDLIERTVQNVAAPIAIEVDRMSTSSLFLNCGLDSISMPRVVRYTRPRVAESLNSVTDPIIRRILGQLILLLCGSSGRSKL